MKDLIKELVTAAAAGLRAETDEGIYSRLESLYMQAVEDSIAVRRPIIEGMEATINRLGNENDRLVKLVIEAPIFPEEEIAMLRTWFAELSDGSVLKLQQSNPEVHDSILAKITQVKKQEVVAA